MSAETRLATYGTLAPGRVNHHHLEGLNGRWWQGTLRGRLVEAGWGADHGFPGLILDRSGEIIDVDVFESAELAEHWERLDVFEGTGYRRVVAQVSTSNSLLDAFVYEVCA